MPRIITCIDGTVYIDERLTIHEWAAQVHAGKIKKLHVQSEDKLMATVETPTGDIWADVPDDVTFALPELRALKGKRIVKIYFADRDLTGGQVSVKKTDQGDVEVASAFPGDYAWGYVGEKPRALAVLILLDVFGEPQDDAIVSAFASRIIGNLPAGKWELPEDDVRKWIKNAGEGVLF